MSGRKKKGIHLSLSKLYSFSCIKSGTKDEELQLGQPGFSRIVYCNDTDNPEAAHLHYDHNYISTTKYTLLSFVPKALFEQFRRVANFYFLVVGCVAFTPLAPYTAVSVLAPLVLVIALTMAKEGLEDWRRKSQDMEVNNRKVRIYGGDGTFHEARWRDLKVGDLVRVEKDDFFPADLLLLSSSYNDAICYVETMNLDGETNLKLKQGLEVTSGLADEDNFQQFKALIKCEDPNENLYTFVGTMYYNEKEFPLSPHQILLRDSKLRNTDFIHGVVIFAGHDTKVMQNATAPPSKRSNIERRMDKIIYLLFSFLLLIATVGSIVFGITTQEDISNGKYKRWYLRPDNSTVFFDPRQAALAAFYHIFTALMLYSYFIPISLYVSIEIVKVLQSMFINQDQHMYYEESDKPARARTSNLNEELGQVDTILSDKTGTLTCNSMEFIKCSIAGVSYGHGLTEVERAMAKRLQKDIPELDDRLSGIVVDDGNISRARAPVKGFNFYDERIMDGNWLKEPSPENVQLFFRILSVCHTVIPEVDDESGKVTYEAESPDEAAFVIAARELGFEFYKRTQSAVYVREFNPRTRQQVDRSYQLLCVLEFNSSRKRMSVIVRDDEGQLLLFSKGADSVMFERLCPHGRKFEAETRDNINQYADAGLRTLVVAYRVLNEEEYESWSREFIKAKNSVNADRDLLIDAAAEKIERDLILVGATAVEDKLQKGVPECIDKLAQAGIKIWVLTGDKMETAINIGFACSLLRQDMKQILITLETPEMITLEKRCDKEAVAVASRESVSRQIFEGKRLVSSAEGSKDTFALIIDGKSLTYALLGNLATAFLELAVTCAAVICCRSSPKQKALVTKLVKTGTGKTTLAIGDGANDVGMLQEADIGVGISGVEGMQAVMSSDFAIAQFAYLERLLLVHGHWCYRRISNMICYFFYKNITFGLTLFIFEGYASFTGQPAYNDWYMSCYNVFFTSLPVIALGVFDQDVPARLCLKYPLLHQEGVQNVLFSWLRIIIWMMNGACSATIIFFMTMKAVENQAFRRNGQPAGYDVAGTMMYNCIVWTVNCQMALSISYFTWIQHVVIWGSIVFWYIFLLVYGSLTPSFSTTAFRVLVEKCAPSFMFWFMSLLIVVTALLLYFSFSAIRMAFFPSYHSVILWNRHNNSASDPGEPRLTRPGSLRPVDIGFSALVDSKMQQLKEKIKPKQ